MNFKVLVLLELTKGLGISWWIPKPLFYFLTTPVITLMTITAAQIKFRKVKIGASSMAQAVGHGYGQRTRAALYHYMRGDTPADTESMAMRVGNFMEAFILDEYNRKTGRGGIEYPDTKIHKDEPRLICHCDGITTKTKSPRLIEIKNVGPHMKDAWRDGVPSYVHIQACGQSMLTEVEEVDVVAYFGGSDLKVYELKFTPLDHAMLYDNLRDFLSYLDKNEEPPHVQADLPMLAEYFDYTGEAIEADDTIIADAVLLAKLKRDAKVCTTDKLATEELEYRIKEYMQDKAYLVNKEGVPLFTWKQGKEKTVVDWEGVANNIFDNGSFQMDERHAYIAEHTTVKSGSRSFLCKIKGGNNG